jgi:hypothetical protein
MCLEASYTTQRGSRIMVSMCGNFYIITTRTPFFFEKNNAPMSRGGLRSQKFKLIIMHVHFFYKKPLH